MALTRPVGFRDFPRLTRFYGITPAELFRTPWWIIKMYAEELPALEAEEQVLRIMAADMPHSDKQQRGRVFRLFERWMPGTEAAPVDVSSESGQAVAAAHGIAFKRVKTPEVES